MTEREWWAATEPRALVDWLFFDALACDRKLRLLCLACCRRLERATRDWPRAKYLGLLEDYADGKFDHFGLAQQLDPFDDELICPGPWTGHSLRRPEPRDFEDSLLYLSCSVTAGTRERKTVDEMPYPTAVLVRSAFLTPDAMQGEWIARGKLLHDIFGPLPFRDIAPDPAWLTSDVLALARGIYEEKAFDRMPILADALQDAGCDSDDILNHCRAEGWEHVRGCWVIDLLLGRPWREA